MTSLLKRPLGSRRGIDWVDTAAIYGLGHSEEVVGRALRELRRHSLAPRRRDPSARRIQAAAPRRCR